MGRSAASGSLGGDARRFLEARGPPNINRSLSGPLGTSKHHSQSIRRHQSALRRRQGRSPKKTKHISIRVFFKDYFFTRISVCYISLYIVFRCKMKLSAGFPQPAFILFFQLLYICYISLYIVAIYPIYPGLKKTLAPLGCLLHDSESCACPARR